MNLQKIRQATELLDSKLIDLQEWTARCLGEDYRGVWSEEYLRRCAVFVRNMLNGADDCESDEKDANILSQLKEAKIELEKERKKLQSENIQYVQNQRLDARADLIQEKIAESIKNLEPFTISQFNKLPQTNVSGLLCISDLHAGSTYEIKGAYNEIVNKYDFDIMRARLDGLLNKMCNDDNCIWIDDITVAVLGDCVENILRTSSLTKLREPVIDTVIKLSEYLADWFVELHDRLEIPVNVVMVGGNHDVCRPLTSKPQFEEENLGKIIVWYLQERLKSVDGITVDDYTDCAIKYIKNNAIMLHHGDGGDIAETMRYFENLYNIDIDECYVGHLHRQEMKNAGITELGDKLCWRVGSVCGVDGFAKSIRKASRPSCMFTTYSEDGAEWRKTFYL